MSPLDVEPPPPAAAPGRKPVSSLRKWGPAMLAVAGVLILLAPWMLEMMTDFSTEVFRAIATVSH